MSNKYLYPLNLSPVPRELVWGGKRLKSMYGYTAPFGLIAEEWVLTCRTGVVNTILNGACAGMTLSDYYRECGIAAYADGDFPLLIKLIDAASDLSVQVHPDDAYAAAHESERGKVEMWYVLRAEAGAKIAYGLQGGVTVDEFAKSAHGDITPMLNYVEAKPGDCFFIPSGHIHAIGAGITLAEVQINSDLTYRIYDYGRPGLDGKPRELHTEKALNVIRAYTKSELDKMRFSHSRDTVSCDDGAHSEVLADCGRFSASLLTLNGGAARLTCGTRFISLLILDGSGVIRSDGIEYSFAKGESWLIPSGLSDVSLTGNAVIIESEPELC